MSDQAPKRRLAHSVSQLMADSESGFGKLLKRARALESLNTRVMRLIDPAIQAQCTLANVREKKMIFACTSPGAATRLRMQAPVLLQELHAAGMLEVEGIEVKLVPPRGRAN